MAWRFIICSRLASGIASFCRLRIECQLQTAIWPALRNYRTRPLVLLDHGRDFIVRTADCRSSKASDATR